MKETEGDEIVKNKEEEEYACSLCGKGFRSPKALGGHMRVHAQLQRLVIQDQTNASSDMDN